MSAGNPHRNSQRFEDRANFRFWHKADIGQLNDLTGGGSFSVEGRADAAILVAERERVATE